MGDADVLQPYVQQGAQEATVLRVHVQEAVDARNQDVAHHTHGVDAVAQFAHHGRPDVLLADVQVALVRLARDERSRVDGQRDEFGSPLSHQVLRDGRDAANQDLVLRVHVHVHEGAVSVEGHDAEHTTHAPRRRVVVVVVVVVLQIRGQVRVGIGLGLRAIDRLVQVARLAQVTAARGCVRTGVGEDLLKGDVSRVRLVGGVVVLDRVTGADQARRFVPRGTSLRSSVVFHAVGP